MRHGLLLVGLVCLLAGASGCDTDQPLQVGQQELEINLRMTSTSVFIYDVWEQYFDADKDGVPDEFDPDGKPLNPPVQVVCQQVVGAEGPEQTNATSVPWGYSLRIQRIPAGSSQPERLTTDAALGENFNLTPFDDVRFEGTQPEPPTCRFDPYDAVVCTPLGRITAANRIVMDSEFDLASQVNPPDIFFRVGVANPLEVFRCPGVPGLRDATMGGTLTAPAPPPFRVNLQPGDTILLEARKKEDPDNGLEVLSDPILTAELTLDGRPVAPIGNTTSTSASGDGISLSFTAQ